MIEGLIAALFVATEAVPASGGTAPAIAAFPFDVYYDVREALTHGENWIWFAAVVLVSIMFRSLVFSSALWLADGARISLALAWLRGAKIAAVAVVALLPSAGLYFTGTAIRYAPFLWLAALLGLVPAVVLARRAVRLDTGLGAPAGKGVPELFGFLSYAYLISLAGYTLGVLGEQSSALAGLFVACLGPLHAAFFLGWREHLRTETFPGGGFAAAAASVAIIGLLLVTTAYDRLLRDPAPVGRAGSGGTLLLLGGIDSTSTSGSLTEFDPRGLGYRVAESGLVSYRGPGQRYSKSDTRRDLQRVAAAVAEQVASAEAPAYLLGHSQAALVLDRMLADGGPAPERAVIFAPSPPVPPPFEVPLPGRDGEGRPGADFARAFAELFDAVGFESFDIDAAASPVRLERVVVPDAIPRVSVWALGDSVWLYRDWRRPGEVNVVAVSDHVGVTNNSRAIDVAKRFFEGKNVEGDEDSWRGALASLIGHAFGPWRPE